MVENRQRTQRVAGAHLISTCISSLDRGTLAGREAPAPMMSAHSHHVVRIELPVHLPGTWVVRLIMSMEKELARRAGQFFPAPKPRERCAAQSWLHRRCSNLRAWKEFSTLDRGELGSQTCGSLPPSTSVRVRQADWQPEHLGRARRTVQGVVDLVALVPRRWRAPSRGGSARRRRRRRPS